MPLASPAQIASLVCVDCDAEPTPMRPRGTIAWPADKVQRPGAAALRAAWGASRRHQRLVAVTNAFLDHAGPPPIAPETSRVEEDCPPVSEEHEPPLMTEEEREAPALSEEAAAEETGAREEGPALSNKTLQRPVRWRGGGWNTTGHSSYKHR